MYFFAHTRLSSQWFVTFTRNNMWLFTKIIEKPYYVDTLQDFRNVSVWEYKQLDRVWVLETCRGALSRMPWWPYFKDVKKMKPVEWIIIWLTNDTYYSEDTEFKKFEKIVEAWWKASSGKIVYKAPWYLVLLKNWETINAYSLKKSHWEFQETFEHMEEMEVKKKKAEQARILYEKSLNEISEELEKWKKLQEKFISSLVTPKK